jgi:leucyl aminopeptidase
MHTMSDPAIDRVSPDGASTLRVLRADEYPAWLAEQVPSVQQWLAQTRFTAEAGQFSWLPVNGGAATIVAVVADGPLRALGDLPYRLPEGRYGLDASWPPEALEHAVLGWGLGAYRFSRYKAIPRPPARLVLPQECDGDWIDAQLQAIYLVRDLINTPAGDLLPDQLEAAARALADEFGAECHSIVGDDLLRENHPTIHAVGRASASAPRLISLRWGDAAHPTLTLVGKGVCFDSGGLNIKPAGSMRLMKKDMGGAAHVLGLARLVMARKLPVQLTVLVPAVENAISGNAFRPGDIIRTRKGLTVEIDNTDAEGRLILCDALALASESRPALIVDFATLTGAARTALGTDLPAMFCNDEDTAAGLTAAARAVDDPIWRMPLHAPYRKMLECTAADLVNSASSPYAGAITAALFLERFVGESTPWVHYDVMAWNTSTQAARPEGGEAMGLRATFAYLQQRFAGR